MNLQGRAALASVLTRVSTEPAPTPMFQSIAEQPLDDITGSA
jgi:hypothetical protein